MAKLKGLPPAAESGRDFVQRLKQVILSGLKVTGIIPAKVFTEPLQGTKLVRVMVTAPKFAALRPSERQDLVWRIVSGQFGPDQQLRISMILTLTPHEVVGKFPLSAS